MKTLGDKPKSRLILFVKDVVKSVKIDDMTTFIEEPISLIAENALMQ